MSQEVNKTREEEIMELRGLLKGKQLKFCEEYLVDMNGTKAAERAGYSEKTARFIASENLTKSNIRRYISLRLDDYQISDSELLKMMGDISRSSVNDYIVTRTVKRTERYDRPVHNFINDLKDEIAYQYRYIEMCESEGVPLDQEDIDDIHQLIKNKEREIVKHKVALEINPNATIKHNREIEEEVTELDIAAMAKDKENGRIKSFANTAQGIKVEMNDADGMIKTLAQIKGLITNKVDATIESNNTNINANVTPEEAKAIADAILKDI